MKHIQTFENFSSVKGSTLNEKALDKDLTAAVAAIMRICDERYQEYFDKGRKNTADVWKDIKEDMVKISKTMEKFNEQESLDESTNRWYNKLIDLGRIGVQFKWVGELSFKTDGIKDAAKKHFPGVDLGDLAIVFKKETGSKWDKARNILGGVLGDDKTSGEFLIVNSKTA